MSRSYGEINYANINHTLGVVEKMVRRHGKDPSVWGVQPVRAAATPPRVCTADDDAFAFES